MDIPETTVEQTAGAMRLRRGELGEPADSRFDLIDDWSRPRSGTRFLRFRTVPTGRDLLVKTGGAWTVEDAESHFLAQSDLADIVSTAAIAGAGVVRPLVWIDSPPLVVMPYVGATDLVTLLRDPTRPEWSTMSHWIGVAGAVLAAFHEAKRSDSESDLAAAIAEVGSAAARMRLPSPAVERLLSLVDPSRHLSAVFGDFGPGNLLGELDGDVYLIDPPIWPQAGLIHRDLGNFLFETRRQLAGRGFTRSRPVNDRFDSLRAAFLTGYFAASSIGVPSDADEGLIALFEMRRAAGMARKRVPRRPGDAAWFLRSALERRREAMRLADHLS